jgi:hypothetical protein
MLATTPFELVRSEEAERLPHTRGRRRGEGGTIDWRAIVVVVSGSRSVVRREGRYCPRYGGSYSC